VVKAGRTNPRWFIERFLWIVDKASQLVLLKLNEPQQRLFEAIALCWKENRPVRILILKARQEGVSTLTEAVMFVLTTLFPHKRSYIAAHDEDSSKKIFAMSRLFYDLLPEPIQPMTRYSNRRELVFENPDDRTRGANLGLGSRFTVETANRLKLGRGDTIQNFHGSEVAHWEHAESVMLAVKQAIPDLPQTMIVLESTANGLGGYFHREWQRAKAGETDFLPLFLPWFALREYRRAPEDPDELRENLTEEEVRLQKQYGLDLEQLAWRRWAIQNKCDGDEDNFRQEYPVDDVEAFLVSGRPVFAPKTLRDLLARCRDTQAAGNLKSEGPRVRLDLNPKGFVKMWRPPEPGHTYVIGADVAEGLETGDYSSAQVLDRRDLSQVAEWHGHCDPDLLGEELVKLGHTYNEALIGCEVNNHGLTTCTTLRRLSYPNIYYRKADQVESIGQKVKTSRIGWRTDLKTRPLMIDALAEALRKDLMRIPSKATVEELLTFVVNANGSTSAQEGCHDDRVVSLAIALQMYQAASLSKIYPSLAV